MTFFSNFDQSFEIYPSIRSAGGACAPFDIQFIIDNPPRFHSTWVEQESPLVTTRVHSFSPFFTFISAFNFAPKTIADFQKIGCSSWSVYIHQKKGIKAGMHYFILYKFMHVLVNLL